MAGTTDKPLGKNGLQYLWTQLKVLLAGKAAAVHSHSASDITSGTLPASRGGTGYTALSSLMSAINNRATKVSSSNTSYGTYMARGIAAGTTDLTAGSSALTSGCIYFVYE